MTKKDYELIASEIRSNLEDTRQSYDGDAVLERSQRENALTCLANGLEYQFSLIDPKFDRNRFLEACGILEYVRSDVDDDGTEVVTYRPLYGRPLYKGTQFEQDS